MFPHCRISTDTLTTQLTCSGQLDELGRQVGNLEVTARDAAQRSDDKLDDLGKQVGSLVETNLNEFEKVLAWLSPFSFAPKHADILASVQPGTGKWFLEDSVFRHWVKGQVKTLWCPGIRKSLSAQVPYCQLT